jgi:hypothetical protein
LRDINELQVSFDIGRKDIATKIVEKQKGWSMKIPKNPTTGHL